MLTPSQGSWGPSWLQVGGLENHFGYMLEGLEAVLAPNWEVLGGLGDMSNWIFIDVDGIGDGC